VLVEGYPFIEEEIEYACKHEMAVTVKDMLTLRMRLAYLNSEAAKEVIPRVTDLMAEQLKWSKKEKAKQQKEAVEYVSQFGGPVADKTGAKLKTATYTDLRDIFGLLDDDKNGYLDERELGNAAQLLGFPFKTAVELKAAFKAIDKDGNGKITEQEFIEWWNKNEGTLKVSMKLHRTMSLTAENEVAIDRLLFDDDKRKKL